MDSFDQIQCEEDSGYEFYNYMLELRQEEEYLQLLDQEYCDFVNSLIHECLHAEKTC